MAYYWPGFARIHVDHLREFDLRSRARGGPPGPESGFEVAGSACEAALMGFWSGGWPGAGCDLWVGGGGCRWARRTPQPPCFADGRLRCPAGPAAPQLGGVERFGRYGTKSGSGEVFFWFGWITVLGGGFTFPRVEC
ncbi:hypothetical protein Ae406Ps2_6390c [Pseudonocardia sp. Ae406_Ps2]|nr:hypothetical protein Ae406Ps2_6390c [Pseudonocardia sp. Ae406_Ps2]